MIVDTLPHDDMPPAIVAATNLPHQPIQHPQWLVTSDVQPLQAQKTHASGQPKAKEYNDVMQELIALAITIYCCFISTMPGATLVTWSSVFNYIFLMDVGYSYPWTPLPGVF
ncbi:hypothetical protein B0H10DRAFT_1951432 [Mycena sp. CBHHK59/15]|nr:hypothetical protein B0H10DRAFT_1951432 [Mycena sp. CBHHK59/15]